MTLQSFAKSILATYDVFLCGRVGRIWERLLPRFDVFRRRELDLGEEVISGTRNPRFGDEAAIPERLGLFV